MVNYEIISSGSHGNATLIDNILIDCGLPFYRFEDYDIKYVIITHVHSDHLNISALKKLVNNKYCKVISLNYDVFRRLKKNNIDSIFKPKYIGKFKLNTFNLTHDVPNNGIELSFKNYNILYATDFGLISEIPKKHFNLVFLEGNYDEDHEVHEEVRWRHNSIQNYQYWVITYKPDISHMMHISSRNS